MAKHDKPIPKSLHTISAIVDVARFVRGSHVMGDDKDARSIRYAMEVLQLAGRDDPHNLEATSLRFLKARMAKS